MLNFIFILEIKLPMPVYKVETLVFHAKHIHDFKAIAEHSQSAIQEKVDYYSRKGYQLAHTNTTSFGLALYIYLYFEM